ncbi:NACHT domain-containing protein [Streptomyces sp. NBC_01214]|uniref:NACHT domain-containing protein n=1 Tax=Streptomyces sp. NBC_01214 TaxID=2903777 RepID=UPI002252A700|nr:NACHT domain-containing protein [Streptomyces sp. NBC_01214]MCX4808929.1 NACHT domain-containing protein [Streptomyces sp. NBC_01214]
MHDDPLDELAQQLRILKAQRGLSMGGLQHRSQLGKTTVSQALSGSRLPSEATVVALARALGAEAEPLLALRQQAGPLPTGPGGPLLGARGMAAFGERYLRFVADRHNQLTVVGLDLGHPGRGGWPLDAAYLSLELAQAEADWWQVTGESAVASSVVRRAEQALAGQRRVLLKGFAGSGKTTLLQWLAVATATGGLPEELGDLHGRIPFVLPLRTLVRRGRLPQPHEFLADTAAPLADLQPNGWADSVLSSRALVLVDGVDEVPQEHRQSARQWLGELLSAYADMRVVVTTRPSAVPEGWLANEKFAELTVRPMNTMDTRIFIGRWHTAACQNASSDEEQVHLHNLEAALQTTVRAQRGLSQLSTTPLMCALICALHRERRGHLPHGRMELYAAALSMLLVRRDHERGIALPEGIQLTEQQSSRLLQRLAYWLIRNQQTEMDHATALVLLNDALPAMPSVAAQGNTEQVLAHLISRTGLLRTPAADTVDFVHRTFQDYLGAQAAVESHDLPLLVNHAHDDQWEDVIRMAVAHARPQEAAELLKKLVERGDREETNRPRLHLSAAASLPYATEIHPDVRGLVEQRASALLPPRSDQEADLLATLGPGILDLLPHTADGLKADEASAVVRTAATIGGDQAYELLQQFARTLPVPGHDASPDFALSEGWANFDANEYAQNILLPRQIGQVCGVTVRTREQLDALGLLSPLKRIAFRGTFTSQDISSNLLAEHTQWLQIYEGQALDSVQFIRDLPGLQELALSECEQIQDLNDLTGLPLSRLRLLQMPDTLSFDAIASMPAVTHLALYTILPWRDLHQLPAPAGLTELALGRWISASVTGISRFPHLRMLIVNHPLDEIEWEEIAALPHLTELYIGESSLDNAAPMLTIKHLTAYSERSDMPIHLIPEHFPNLETLSLTCRNWVPDITPLQELHGLRLSLAQTPHAVGLDGFPPNAVTLHPRPRTPVLPNP